MTAVEKFMTKLAAAKACIAVATPEMKVTWPEFFGDDADPMRLVEALDTGCRLLRMTDRVRRVAREGRITLASQERVGEFMTEVDEVLDALGFPEALVTDKTRISDFDLDPEALDAASDKLNLNVQATDYLIDIAQRIRQRVGGQE